MPSYELCYFDARARGEVTRLCFSYAGIPFKDSRHTDEQWATLKSDTNRFPLAQAPVLLIDGIPLSESHAINRYVAKKTGLDGGPDPDELAFVDQAYEVCRSLVDAVDHLYMVAFGFEKGDKDQLYKDLFVPNVQKHFPKIISLLKPSGFFSDKGVTFADFYIAGFIESYLELGLGEEVNKYPRLLKHLDDVKRIPQIQEYLKVRPAA